MRISATSSVIVEESKPYDQKPGTSGLRKKATQWFNEDGSVKQYLRHFVAACLHGLGSLSGAHLIIGGDGRWGCQPAIQAIIEAAAAAGVTHVVCTQDGLLSTPAASALIRAEKAAHPDALVAGFLLTASHNPGGPQGDFGIKINTGSGAPAPESLTSAISANAGERTSYSRLPLPIIPLDTQQSITVADATGADIMQVTVTSPSEQYMQVLSECFDVEKIRRLVAHPGFSMVFDGMHGVAGAYAEALFHKLLGGDPARVVLANCTPSPTFGTPPGHPDPNLTYAAELVKRMGLAKNGTPLDSAAGTSLPYFGAACDGDADRNMILGSACFIAPSDSLAVLAANSGAIQMFAARGGLRSVARSMPTSSAVDVVAKAEGMDLYVTPTGWKYFGNLLDDPERVPLMCGEESFGTGADHVREKDGMWAILAWLSVLAEANAAVLSDSSSSSELVPVSEVMTKHWAKYGRHYYCRYDFEEVAAEAGDAVMTHLRELVSQVGTDVAAVNDRFGLRGDFAVVRADEFEYVDPVDASVSSQQGMQFWFADGSRVVWRLSGTGSVGATVRVYFERYTSASDDVSALNQAVHVAVTPLADAALKLCRMQELTGRDEPTVIT